MKSAVQKSASLDAAAVADTEATCETSFGQPATHILGAPHEELLKTAFTCLMIAPQANW